MTHGAKIMRSQLGRARGLGSAKTGTEHWWVERVTAAALVPLSLWFVFSVLAMLGADQPVVAAWVARPINAALLLALVLMSFRHAALGLQVVLEDYVHGAVRTASILGVKAAALLLGLIATLAVIKLFLAAH
ncbi:MAG: succinate dehydrogenase, hydrophobic membrane anchor protein [Rhodospirillales bacterium]